MCVQLLCSENGETDFQWICYIIFSFVFKIRNWLLTVNIVDFNLLGIVYISQSSHYCNWPLLAMPSNLHTFFYWVLFTIYLKIIFILVCIHQLATSFKFSVFLFLSWTCFWGLCQRLEAVYNKKQPLLPNKQCCGTMHYLVTGFGLIAALTVSQMRGVTCNYVMQRVHAYCRNARSR